MHYTVGGLEAKIEEGSTVVLFTCGGVLTPVEMPDKTTIRTLKE
jgi:hypothetical protein